MTPVVAWIAAAGVMCIYSIRAVIEWLVYQ